MKTFLLFYKEADAYLRQKNTLFGLISEKAFFEHEHLYEESAELLLNPVFGKTEYFESELDWYYQFRETPESLWIDCGEPSFIDSKPLQYRRIIRVRDMGANSFQEKARTWLVTCFGEEMASDKTERAFRLLEEALELVQACGLSMHDIQRQVVYTLNRPTGELSQEAGGVMVTLAVLCHANGINMLEAGEAAIFSNYERMPQIREKQAKRIKAFNNVNS